MIKMRRIILYMCLVLSAIYTAHGQQKKVVCYWNSNSEHHEGLKGEFHPSNIDPNICTHIIYTYIRFSEGLQLGWSYRDNSNEFLNLKSINPDVKLIVGVGGPQWGSQIPSRIVSTETGRNDLARTIKTFLDDHPRFDGCDIDWQYPAQGLGSSNDFQNFPKFLRSLRQIIPSQKSVSISVAPRNEDIEKSYDVPTIVDIVDFVNLNSFDMRGMLIAGAVTALHSPFRKDENDLTPEAAWNAYSIVNSWITRASPAEKLTLGIATYGRSFTLTDPKNNSVGSPVSSLGNPSEFLQTTRIEKKNVIPYGEICLQNDGWEYFWNEEHFAPYATFGENQWVGYDDEDSVAAKIHLVLENDLGGINYASLDYDDFAGNCGGSKFPLIFLGYDALINGNIPENPIETTTTTPRPGVISTTTIPDEVSPPAPDDTTTEGTETEPPTETEPTVTDPTKTEDPITTEPVTTTPPTTPTTTTRPTTTSKTTTTTREFSTPPVTPSTPSNEGQETGSTKNPADMDPTPTDATTTNEETTTEEQETPTDSTQRTTTTVTQGFKTPPVTPTTTLEPPTEETTTSEDDSGEEGSGDSDESSEEGSGESDESSEEGSGGSDEEGSSSSSPDDETTSGNESGEVTDETTEITSTAGGGVTDDGNTEDGITTETTSTGSGGVTDDGVTDGITNDSTLPDDGANGPTAPTDDSETTTTTKPFNFVCPIPNGNFAHPINCSKFIICANYIPYEFPCQEGLYYNAETDQCDYDPTVCNN